jgi:hypothetical protein
MPAVTTKVQYLEYKKIILLKQLQSLLEKLEEPGLTPEKLESVKAQVAECQQRFQELISNPNDQIQDQ